jgi:Protein of unknown function (DUF4242)
MPSYCLELYLPRGSNARIEKAADDARRAAEALSTDGVPIRYVRSTYLDEDETCFHLFEAESAQEVAAAAHRAGLTGGRITPAIGAGGRAHKRARRSRPTNEEE